MSFKAFSPDEIQPLSVVNDETVSISKNSPCASHVHFFTGIKTIGDLESLESSTFNPTFGLNRKDVVRYKWQFDSTPLPDNISITAEKVFGVFVSTADQTFLTQTGESSISHQNVFEHVKGYLYRNDNSYDARSASALNSSSSAHDVSVIRNINFRKDVNSDAVRPTTFYMEMNRSHNSITGYVSGPSAQSTFLTTNVTGYTAALDLKNPYGGDNGTTVKSFFEQPVYRFGQPRQYNGLDYRRGDHTSL